MLSLLNGLLKYWQKSFKARSLNSIADRTSCIAATAKTVKTSLIAETIANIVSDF
jgi:hypothetical protein